jgi:hypothetical protein
MRPRKTLLVAALAAGAALAAPAGAPAHGQQKLLDYELVQRTLPKLKELGGASHASILEMHELFEKLDSGLTTPEKKETRAAIQASVEGYMHTKQEMKQVLRDVLEIQARPKTDEEVMEIIHETELFDVNWNDDTFRKCMKDLSKALGVRVRLAYHVVQMNTVTMRFRRAQASTILGSLCNYFELRYVIQDGEVVVFKKITPNEYRFLEYQEKHPDVKLKYWEREDASGEYVKEKK